MIKKQGFIIILLIIVVVGTIFLFSKNRIVSNIKEKEHKEATEVEKVDKTSKADYIFETIDGTKLEINVEDNAFHVKGLEHKIIFLKIFGWDCQYCQKEIPQLIKLKKELGDSFEVIAIEAEEHTIEESKEAIKKYGINYYIVSGDTHKDFYHYLQEKYGWTGVIPLTIVIAEGGKVLAFELGEKSYSLSELMKAALLRK